MNKQAVFILSGKLLDSPFPLKALRDLCERVEEELSERGVVLTRRVATLAASRGSAAHFFLDAGFETVPADDEDVQASLAMCAAAYSDEPPDEIVFALGLAREPVYLSRSLSGRVSPTRLYFPESNESAPDSGSFQNATCRTIDVRDLFEKNRSTWKELEFASWDEWNERIDDLLSELFDSQPEGDAPTKPKTVELKPVETAPRDERVVVDYEGELRKKTVEEFSKIAPFWNEAILAFLDERGHRSSVYSVTSALDAHFPGLCNFSMKYRDEFRDLLCDSLRMFVEDANVMFLYDFAKTGFGRAREAGRRLGSGSRGFGRRASVGTKKSRRDAFFRDFIPRERFEALLRGACRIQRESAKRVFF